MLWADRPLLPADKAFRNAPPVSWMAVASSCSAFPAVPSVATVGKAAIVQLPRSYSLAVIHICSLTQARQVHNGSGVHFCPVNSSRFRARARHVQCGIDGGDDGG